MVLELMHPATAALSCDDCERWLHTDGVLSRRAGLPVARPKGVVTPCWKCPKIPEDAPGRSRRWAQQMSARNRAVYRHYLECRATQQWPDDPIVRANARVIASVYDALERSRWEQVLMLLSVRGVSDVAGR